MVSLECQVSAVNLRVGNWFQRLIYFKFRATQLQSHSQLVKSAPRHQEETCLSYQSLSELSLPLPHFWFLKQCSASGLPNYLPQVEIRILWFMAIPCPRDPRMAVLNSRLIFKIVPSHMQLSEPRDSLYTAGLGH